MGKINLGNIVIDISVCIARNRLIIYFNFLIHLNYVITVTEIRFNGHSKTFIKTTIFPSALLNVGDLYRRTIHPKNGFRNANHRLIGYISKI